MRVLHVYRTYFPDSFGGLEQALRQIALGTARLGVNNRIFTLSRTPDPRIITSPEAEIYRFPLHLEIASNSFSVSAIAGFRKLAAWADIIHYHFPWPFADLLHFLAGIKRPAVLTYHSDIVRQQTLLRLYQPLMRWFLNAVDSIVATSPNYLASSQVLQAYRNKVQVIPFGLDKASYPTPRADTIHYWRNRIGERFFLFVGLLRYYKGLHILLQAAQGTKLPIVIVGGGPSEQELKRCASRLDLNHVHFLGSLPEEDKVALLQLALAVVLPSHLRSEAFGISLLEGAMFGKPLISAEIGTGTTYINSHGETGIVVAPADPIALREAMQQLFSNPTLCQQLGLRAKERYTRLFTADVMAKNYYTLYSEILNNKSFQ